MILNVLLPPQDIHFEKRATYIKKGDKKHQTTINHVKKLAKEDVKTDERQEGGKSKAKIKMQGELPEIQQNTPEVLFVWWTKENEGAGVGEW